MKQIPSLKSAFLPIPVFSRALALLGLALFTPLPLQAEILIKSGDKIAFLGDSITQQGWKSYNGYVQLVMVGLEANGIKAEAIPEGISGNKSNQMLARLPGILGKNPQWMTLSCGVNDVWHSQKGNGIPLDDREASDKDPNISGKPGSGTYEKNITAIIDQAQAANVKPVILTATVIQETLDNPLNKKLEAYNDFLRKLARKRNLPLADLNAIFQEKLKKEQNQNQKMLTVDGVHMNPEGNKLMATGVLTTFGLNAEELKKAEEAWSRLAPPPPPAPKPAQTPGPASAPASNVPSSPEPAATPPAIPAPENSPGSM